MLKTSLADLRQYYDRTLVYYKRTPVYVKGISEDRKFNLLNLKTQKTDIVKDAENFVTAPVARLGMLNINGGCVYIERIPIRRYQIGISSYNTSCKYVPGPFLEDREVARIIARSFKDVAHYDMLLNKYPSFEQAIQHVKAFGGTVAFDKQFALCVDGWIYYKTRHVGKYVQDGNLAQIRWEDGEESLSALLGGKYAKAA